MLTERRFNIQPSTGRTERYQYRRVRGGDRGEHVGSSSKAEKEDERVVVVDADASRDFDRDNVVPAGHIDCSLDQATFQSGQLTATTTTGLTADAHRSDRQLQTSGASLVGK